jgi:hypothetical protein
VAEGGGSLRPREVMDIPAETLAGTSASSHPRKKQCTEAKRASALSAKAERGRVKNLHRQNTMLYYASSRTRPLEVGGVLFPSSTLGSAGSSSSAPGQTAILAVEVPAAIPAVELPLGDSAAVAGSPASESDARHEGCGWRADCIVISSTEDGGAETTNDLEEVSLSDDDDEENLDTQTPKKKPRKNYDLTRKFQLEWACKLPWAEGILTNNGRLHMVKCTVCSTMEKSDRLMQPKWDTLKKHEGRRKATRNMPAYNVKKGEWYMAKDSKHKKNMALFNARAPDTVLQQLNQSNRLEREKKKVQFATLFQILKDGRPMLEYESRAALYEFLNVPNFPRMHWSDNSGWTMAECMYAEVRTAISRVLVGANYVALTCDEVSTIDNGSWISIHAYVVQNWSRIPFLISLERVVEGGGSDNLTQVIIDALTGAAKIERPALSKTLLCFGADGVSTFQGAKTGVTQQIQSKYAPFAVGVHCMAHRCNLAFKTLSQLDIMNRIEGLLASSHAYFKHSPKRHLEFMKLAELMETKGLKLLKNVKTRWVSLIEPLRRILQEYRVLLAKMKADSLSKEKSAQVIFLFILFVLFFYCFFICNGLGQFVIGPFDAG